MAHPYAKNNESAAGKSRAAHLMKGYKKGGAVHKDEAQDKKLIKSMMAKEEKGESKVEGRASGGRLDKFARGGHAKGKGKHKGGNHVNILIAGPHGPGAGGAPGLPPGGPPMPPPGALPPGGPPMMPPPGGPPMKRGGKVKMTAGADTGKGRLEKKKAYGIKPNKG